MAGGRIYEGFVPGRHLIDAYGNGGFRFAEMSHRGSILVLPSGVLRLARHFHGRCRRGRALRRSSREGPELELLLFGTGLDIAAFPEAWRARFRAAGIGLDVMQTGAAARTYNILLAENRKVGAALIAVP